MNQDSAKLALDLLAIFYALLLYTPLRIFQRNVNVLIGDNESRFYPNVYPVIIEC